MGRPKKELAKKEDLANAIQPVQITADDIRKFLCPRATDKELYMALNIIKSYNLNPFKREVHIIKYGDSPAQIVVGYEVYLKRAERTGKLDGWCVKVADDNTSATITIYRKDWSKPFEWTVYRSEVDKGQSTWKTMPKFMLEKVAIGQGFRLCFPDELGGLPYLREEIADAPAAPPVETITVEEVPQTPQPEQSEVADEPKVQETVENSTTISEAQRKRLFAVARANGISDDELKEILAGMGISSTKDILKSEYDEIIEILQRPADE